MAEIKVTLDAKYNKPAGDVDAVQKESILPTLQGLCTGPEYNSAKEDICDALKLLITYPEGLDEDEEDITKREGRGVMEPNKVDNLRLRLMKFAALHMPTAGYKFYFRKKESKQSYVDETEMTKYYEAHGRSAADAQNAIKVFNESAATDIKDGAAGFTTPPDNSGPPGDPRRLIVIPVEGNGRDVSREVALIMIHEITHFAYLVIYNNSGEPFAKLSDDTCVKIMAFWKNINEVDTQKRLKTWIDNAVPANTNQVAHTECTQAMNLYFGFVLKQQGVKTAEMPAYFVSWAMALTLNNVKWDDDPTLNRQVQGGARNPWRDEVRPLLDNYLYFKLDSANLLMYQQNYTSWF